MSGHERLKRAHAALEQWRGVRAVIGWSGGLDSTVLLHMARLHGLDIHAVHVDHGLRPSSVRDAAFCAGTARRWGVPSKIERIDVRGAGSSQERARLQRYAALANAAHQAGAALVLTAHHGEDALETALLNRERGAREFGLTSLLRRSDRGPIPSWPPHVALERPMLGLLRRDIERYAAEHILKWVDDPTNTETDYRRNQIRHELLPELTDDGVQTEQWLAELRVLAARASRWQDEAEALLDVALLAPVDAESRALRATPLVDAAPEPRARALQRAASDVDCTLRREHLAELVETIESGGRTRISVGGGVVNVWDGLIFIERARGRGGKHLADRRAPSREAPIGAPGVVFRWFDTQIRLEPAEDYDGPVLKHDASEPLSIEGGATRIFSHGNDGPVPPPLRWKWPRVRTTSGTRALSDESVLVRQHDGALVEVRWCHGPDTVWAHACARTK